MPVPPEPLWNLGGIGIHVDEFSGDKPAVIGEQHVLDAANSTKHHSGSMGQSRRLGGTLFDTAASSPMRHALETFPESSTAKTLTSDVGNEGSFNVMSVQWERRQALNYDYPVYRVTLELKEA